MANSGNRSKQAPTVASIMAILDDVAARLREVSAELKEIAARQKETRCR